MTLTATDVGRWINDTFDLSEPRTLNDRALLLRLCINLQADLATIRGALEHSLAEDMESEAVETEAGVLERAYKPISPKWDGRRLAYVVKEKVQPATDDGEALSVVEYGDAVTEALIEASGIDNASHSWRKTKLRALGIDFKSYVDTDGWRTTVRFQ